MPQPQRNVPIRQPQPRLRELFSPMIGQRLDVVLAQTNFSIYFTKVHIADLKRVIEVDSAPEAAPAASASPTAPKPSAVVPLGKPLPNGLVQCPHCPSPLSHQIACKITLPGFTPTGLQVGPLHILPLPTGLPPSPPYAAARAVGQPYRGTTTATLVVQSRGGPHSWHMEPEGF